MAAARGRKSEPAPSGIYRVKEGFAVPGIDGFPRTYQPGQLVGPDDPVSKSHTALLEPVEVAAADYSTDKSSVRLPSGLSVAEATEPHYGHAHKTGAEINMAHSLPPEDENSPASPFAPFQPGAGVVADDVPEAQNVAGGTKAADYSGPTAEDFPKVQAEKAKLENPELGDDAADRVLAKDDSATGQAQADKGKK